MSILHNKMIMTSTKPLLHDVCIISFFLSEDPQKVEILKKGRGREDIQHDRHLVVGVNLSFF